MILRNEIARTMKLLEIASVDEVEPGHVTQVQRLVPRRRNPSWQPTPLKARSASSSFVVECLICSPVSSVARARTSSVVSI